MSSVLAVLRPFGAFLRVRNIDIYNGVFKLHTRLTFLLLLGFSALVSTNEFFGKPMDCWSSGGDNDRRAYFNNLCWINGTYTMAEDHPRPTFVDVTQQSVTRPATSSGGFGGASRSIGVHMPAPGVFGDRGHQQRVYHYYYQWVNILLFAQAVLCYVPAYMWKIWEHGHMKMLCRGLDSPLDPDGHATRRQNLMRYLLADNHRNVHTVYALRFHFCEAANLVSVLANMLLLHLVIDGFWLRYAPAIGALLRNDRAAWMTEAARVFPKVAKCEYGDYGPSGSLQRLDLICVLALNILNEKIFALLWLWFIGLLTVSAVNVLYRAVCLSVATVRVRLVQALVPELSLADVRVACRGASVGECFVLGQMGRNVHPMVFGEIMVELVQRRREMRNGRKRHAGNGVVLAATAPSRSGYNA